MHISNVPRHAITNTIVQSDAVGPGCGRAIVFYHVARARRWAGRSEDQNVTPWLPVQVRQRGIRVGVALGIQLRVRERCGSHFVRKTGAGGTPKAMRTGSGTLSAHLICSKTTVSYGRARRTEGPEFPETSRDVDFPPFIRLWISNQIKVISGATCKGHVKSNRRMSCHRSC